MVTVTVMPMMMMREIYIMVTTDHDANYDCCQKNDPDYDTDKGPDPDQGADPLQGYDQGADSDPGHLHKDLSLAKSFEPWG